ncbi:MAG: hypothetical protein AAB502_09585, partial [Chloroflexota bacterium]
MEQPGVSSGPDPIRLRSQRRAGASARAISAAVRDSSAAPRDSDLGAPPAQAVRAGNANTTLGADPRANSV